MNTGVDPEVLERADGFSYYLARIRENSRQESRARHAAEHSPLSASAGRYGPDVRFLYLSDLLNSRVRFEDEPRPVERVLFVACFFVIETAGDAAMALRPAAGVCCAGLFAFGLMSASLFGAAILPISTATPTATATPEAPAATGSRRTASCPPAR